MNWMERVKNIYEKSLKATSYIEELMERKGLNSDMLCDICTDEDDLTDLDDAENDFLEAVNNIESDEDIEKICKELEQDLARLHCLIYMLEYTVENDDNDEDKG